MTTFKLDGKKYLIIGGTQFMGRLVVKFFVEEGAEVTVLNRGITPSPFVDNPQVRHINCDRLNDRKRFRQIIKGGVNIHESAGSKRKSENTEQNAGIIPWDGVVDFVCFGPKNMQDIVDCLKTKHYIFISSDSVYMACDAEKTLNASRTSGGLLLEKDVYDPVDVKALKRRNPYQYDYGNGKLQCEKVLLQSDSFRQFTILRFPDV
jgi:nucleoside-diphosphate-sugar epimerase